jgi:uncharacterized membrane protein
MAKNNNSESKIVAILLYIVWIVGVVWYLVDEKMQKNKFAKFHLKQSIVLVIASIVWSIAYSIVYGILGFVTMGFFLFVGWVGFYLPLVWVIQGLVHAAKEEEKELWLIGKFAKKLTF